MVVVGRNQGAAFLMEREQQRRAVGPTRQRDQNPMCGRDQARCTEPKEQRVGNGRWVRGKHGGAGWTRTTDNAIMSRALYRLSYGTPAPGVKPTWQPALLLLAWPSSCGASRSRRAFFCSTGSPQNDPKPQKRLRGWTAKLVPQNIPGLEQPADSVFRQATRDLGRCDRGLRPL